MAEGPGLGSLRWADVIQFYELPFRLGNDLVFQHQDIAGNEFLFLVLQRGQKQGCEGCAGADLTVQRNGNNAQFLRGRSGIVLAVLRVDNLSIAGCERAIG